MIARPKMSQNEWKTTEIRASKVGNFSPFSCPGLPPLGSRAQGLVKWFDWHEKKYGFLTPDVGGEGVFIHRVDLLNANDVLNPGDRVEYTVGVSPENGRPKAFEVAKLPSRLGAPPNARAAPSALASTAKEGDFLYSGNLIRGKINWFDPAKHFGFLTTEFGGEDMFIHGNDVVPDQFPLPNGQDVVFKVVLHKGRPKAVDLSHAPLQPGTYPHSGHLAAPHGAGAMPPPPQHPQPPQPYPAMPHHAPPDQATNWGAR